MKYDLWDTESRNLIETFETEKDAELAKQEYVEANEGVDTFKIIPWEE